MAYIGEMQYLTIGDKTYSIAADSGGSTVSIVRNLTSGTKSATITVDETSYDLYAPTPNAGTVTSVRVQATSPVQSSTSTAQSNSLNTTISLANGYGDTKNPYGTKTKNYVLAGPTTGNDAAPTFRALVAADIPDLSGTYLTSYTETDPVYSASAASGITSSDISNWNSKTSNTGTITSVKTTAGAHTTINVSSGAANFNVPTATSHLTNDSGFITSFTDEKVKAVSQALDNSDYYLIFGSNNGTAETKRYSSNLYLKLDSTNNAIILKLGSSSTAGRVVLFDGNGASDKTITLKTTTVTAARTITLPDKTGTIALTSDIPDVSSFITDAGVTKITTTAGTHTAITNATGAVSFNVPTKTSHLTNDSGFITNYTDEKVKTNAATASSNYYVLMGTNTDQAETKIYDTRIKYSYTNGTSSTPGIALLSLGNDSNVLPNSIKGRIKLYAQSGSVTIDPGTSQNSTVLTLPNTTGTLALTSDIPDTSGFISTETDPIFSASAAAGITSTDISNWNAKVSDDKTWNGVELNLNGGITGGSLYVPARANKTATTAYQLSANTEPTAQALALYNSNAYLNSTTPSANDNSTKVATTAYVDAAIPDISGKVSKSGDTMTGNLTMGDNQIVFTSQGTNISLKGSFYYQAAYDSTYYGISFTARNSDTALLRNIRNPIVDTDAANKQYVDSAVGAITVPTNISAFTNDSGYIIANNTTITLTAAGWSNNSQTITLSGVTSSNIVFIMANESSTDEYVDCEVSCISQGTDSLTFSCTSVPSNNLILKVIVFIV